MSKSEREPQEHNSHLESDHEEWRNGIDMGVSSIISDDGFPYLSVKKVDRTEGINIRERERVYFQTRHYTKLL